MPLLWVHGAVVAAKLQYPLGGSHSYRRLHLSLFSHNQKPNCVTYDHAVCVLYLCNGNRCKGISHVREIIKQCITRLKKQSILKLPQIYPRV